MVNKNVICVIDGAAGSCGKAKVIGEIALDSTIKVGASVTNCMPNAGHTFVSENGQSFVFRNIPVAIVNPNTDLFIGPGSAIDMDVFVKEYDSVEFLLRGRKIYVHEMVPLIEERHKEYERINVKSGSTFKGCGAVSKDKIMRVPDLRFFKSYKNAVCVSGDEYFDKLYRHLDNANEYVILEGAQGCDLSLNHSGNYPFVTSRNVSSAQLLADSGIAPSRLLETIMVIRPFPIRISNVTNDGQVIYTGGYGTGLPLTWSQINLAAKCGFYPTQDDFLLYPNNLDDDMKSNLLLRSSNIALKQIFGENYKNVKLEDITLLDALEMERLINKSYGMREYVSKVVDLSVLGDSLIRDLSEQTTVTKQERRVFDLDINKLKNNCIINDPYGLYLNFFQHLDLALEHVKGNYLDAIINRYQREYINWLEYTLGYDILALGTGKCNNERINIKSLIKR